ncbi:MAG TPA: TolC family protein [Chlamydiales bacterium]|nr:TolC family protein [Chlamydiales bacterium]
MIKKSIVALLVFSSSILFANSETFTIDLPNAVKMALKESEDYQIQDNEVLKATAQYKEIMSILFPQIKGDVTWVKNFKYPNSLPTAAFTKNYNIDYGLSANQLLTTFGRISSSLKGTRKFEEAAAQKKRAVALEITFATKMMYYNACFTKNMMEIAKESYLSTLESKEILLERFHGGRVSKRDNIKVDADIAGRIPMIAEMETSHIASLDTLKRHLGIDFTDQIDLTSSYSKEYPEVDEVKAFQLMYENHPLLKALTLVTKGQEYLVRSKKAEYYPTLSAFAKYNYRGMSDDNLFVGNQFLNDYGVYGLNVNIPIFQGFKRHQQIKKAKLDKDNACLTYEKHKKQLELELKKTLLEYNELKQTLSANAEAVFLANKSFDMSQNLLKTGQMSVTDLNDAELMLTSQKIKYETTLFKLNVALIKLEKLTGEKYSNG